MYSIVAIWLCFLEGDVWLTFIDRVSSVNALSVNILPCRIENARDRKKGRLAQERLLQVNQNRFHSDVSQLEM